ncbi:UDP-N-acetylglucosamine/UDP-glucose/GDP-mannose transporter-like protein [Dinothrombium tinctorium]|uniref:UDP-N-acetylglucosamine/UDP-glucose/GDP-mannose transporter-like protein n=1 Tax=Dinothrombium tinctorium TaxID=1965070 RepID=A0A3S3QTD5_9ACAR|nr:UDP-N-acetylglucosamine/UDP-glucose/GDP-mannose transporter-like protein [Dinothrombium tinctorium]
MNGKVLSSIFYGVLGLVVVFLNKTVLTRYKYDTSVLSSVSIVSNCRFPAFSVLGTLQAITIITVLRLAKVFKIVNFPDFSMSVVKQIFPLPIFYVINLLSSLGATKRLNLPMYVVLRRFGILITMILQIYFLNIIPSKRAAIAIFVIIAGSVFAALEDLNFDMIGYFFILLYDLFDSCEAILVKMQLNDRKSVGQIGILYYCALFSFLPLCLFVLITGDYQKAFVNYEGWNDISFVCLFFSCSLASATFLYAYIMCTDYNNPVLSQVIACMRNILTTYIGMYVGGDYIFNLYNFIALNLTMFAAFYYTYINLTETEKSDASKSESNEKLLNEV